MMLHKEHSDKTTLFVNNTKSGKVDKSEPNTSRATINTSAYDRVVQLGTNDNAEPLSQQQPQGQEHKQKVHIIV